MSDPFGFEAAINWAAVEEHADEIAAMFEPDALDQQRQDAVELRAEMEQDHWEQDPEYMALYFPPEEED